MFGTTVSWETEMIPKRRPYYECDYCGVELEDHETFTKEGKVYCGCCFR